MGDALTREELLERLKAAPVDLVDFEVPGWGVFKLRPLTKYDQRQIRDAALQDDGTNDTGTLETGLFLAGVAEPKLDADDLEQLLRSMSAGVYDSIITRIAEMSAYDLDQESVERRFPGATT